MSAPTWYENLTLHRSDYIARGTTARYSFVIHDEAGTALTLAQITTLTLTIVDLEPSPPVVLTAPARDIKNLNGGTIDSLTGLLTLVVPREDHGQLVAGRNFERRRWVIEWTYGSSASKTMRRVVDRLIDHTTGV